MKLLIEQGTKGDSDVLLLRSKLRAVSRRMGFSDIKREQMELVCNEMVTNQIKFAEGNGLVQIWEATQPQPALDLFAFDYGPGIQNVKAAIEDGFTTAGTMGKGLGAIQRLSSENEIYSVTAANAGECPWHGTAVWSRFYPNSNDDSLPHQVGNYTRAYLDSGFNGDLIQFQCSPKKTRLLHMDGLGHGREAARVVDGIGRFLDDETPVDGLMQRLSKALEHTRGAVGMVCEIDAAAQTIKVCGVGDMVAYLIASGDKKVISFSPGVLGHTHRTPETTVMPFPSHALFIACSDGLRRSMSLRTFPELWRLHPQIIALVLGQVMGRHNDDRSVFTLRVKPRTRKQS